MNIIFFEKIFKGKVSGFSCYIRLSEWQTGGSNSVMFLCECTSTIQRVQWHCAFKLSSQKYSVVCGIHTVATKDINEY